MDPGSLAGATADLCDEVAGARWLPVPLRDFGGRAAFRGVAATVRCFEDNAKAAALLDEPGRGRVLIVDGGGSSARALFGDMMGAKVQRNNWAGVVVLGAVRDTAQLKLMDIGVKALHVCPRKSDKSRGNGELNVVLECGGVSVEPGDYVVADADGVVIVPKHLLLLRTTSSSKL